jgi:tRNA dimethylallyltransferase
VDVANPDENWSLARFQKQTAGMIEEIHGLGKVPLGVGGTGQYIRAITDGWQIPEIQEDPHLRQALNDWADQIGREALHQRLGVLDPAAAQKMDPRNLRRTVRALEVIFRTGKRFSEQRSRQPRPYRILKIGLTRPKEELFDRIDARIDAMMQEGFLMEVRSLLEKYPPNLRCFSAIGYRQLIAHLQGEMTLDEAVEEIKRQTKKFVRRQYTWFKPDDPEIDWFEIGENTLEDVTQKVRDFLAGQ